MDLSVIVVNWNTRELLAQCLQSIYATVKDLDFEVYVVDNASGDGSQQMVLTSFPAVCLIENKENAGFARANNQAIRESRGAYVLLLNSDAALTEGAANRMVAVMKADPRVGIVGARLVYPDGRPQISYAPLPTLWREAASLAGLDKRLLRPVEADPNGGPVAAGMVDGACLMARRQALDEFGLLDERFFMFNEEVDLCKRAHAAGWKVLHVPDAVTIHVAGGSTGITAGRILRLYRGKLQYFEKHGGRAARGRLYAGMLAVSSMKAFLYAIRHAAEKKALWQEVSQGLRDM